MKWTAAATAILERLCRDDGVSEETHRRLRQEIERSDSDASFSVFRQAVGSARGWNKFWAGGTLFGWWGGIVSEEPLRLAAIEANLETEIGRELARSLLERWHERQGGNLSSEAYRLAQELGLFPERFRLCASELRFLRRLNLDAHDHVEISGWRWSRQAGVVTLSDEGRIAIKPELAATRLIETILDERSNLPVYWRDRLLGLTALEVTIDAEDLPEYHRFLAAVEFWGLGQKWKGGVRLFEPAPRWLGRLARLYQSSQETLNPHDRQRWPQA